MSRTVRSASPATPSLLEAAEYDGAHFTNLSAQELVLAGTSFYDCRFSACLFPEVKWTDCRFVGCRFETCNLNLAEFLDCSFREVFFVDCRLSGVDWTRLRREPGLPPEIDFERCSLDYGDFSRLDLRDRSLVECSLREAVLNRTLLQGANCCGSDFHRTNFVACDLRGADFRTARNYIIDPTSNRLAGAKFSLPGVFGLLSGFGIELS